MATEAEAGREDRTRAAGRSFTTARWRNSEWMDEPAGSAEPGEETNRDHQQEEGGRSKSPLERVEINDQKQDRAFRREEEPRSQQREEVQRGGKKERQ